MAFRFVWLNALPGDGRLSPTELHVARLLASYMDDDGGNCRPSLRRLSAQTHLSEERLRHVTSRLRSLGWLERVRRSAPTVTPMHRPRIVSIPAEHRTEWAEATGDGDAEHRSRVTGDVVEHRSRVTGDVVEHRSRVTEHRSRVTTTPVTGDRQDTEIPEIPTCAGSADAEDAATRQSTDDDPISTALLAACGIDPAEMTDTARGALRRATRDLTAVRATPDAIAARARVYRRQWPNVTLTPSALAKHWAELAAVRSAPPSRPASPVPVPDDGDDVDAGPVVGMPPAVREALRHGVGKRLDGDGAA